MLTFFLAILMMATCFVPEGVVSVWAEDLPESEDSALAESESSSEVTEETEGQLEVEETEIEKENSEPTAENSEDSTETATASKGEGASEEDSVIAEESAEDDFIAAEESSGENSTSTEDALGEDVRPEEENSLPVTDTEEETAKEPYTEEKTNTEEEKEQTSEDEQKETQEDEKEATGKDETQEDAEGKEKLRGVNPLPQENTIDSLTATPVGDRMIKLEWNFNPPSPPDGLSMQDWLAQYRYLIYRAESADGTFTKIGYTAFGSMTYTDAGGEGSLTSGTTYYYKIQAYNPTEDLSSNLYNAPIESATAVGQPKGANEFSLESERDDAVAYLRQRMVNRDETVELKLWVNNWTPGDDKPLFQEAVAETENVSLCNEGDYLWYHLYGEGYDAVVTDEHICRNGSSLYTLTYTFSYYTTYEQEQQVMEAVNNAITSFGFTSETSTAEKVKKVYEWLSEGASYDMSVNDDGKPRCSAYDAIVNKRAVCQGYANAAYLFLRRLGIMNRIIDGYVDYYDGYRTHAWNLVKIGGKWYNVCVTTEVHMREDYSTLSYRYLLKADDAEYMDIFTRRNVEARGIDYDGSAFRSAHPVTESYDLSELGITGPTLPAGQTAVTDTTAVSAGNLKIRLSWSYEPPEGSELGDFRYLIHRAESEDGTYNNIGYTDLGETTYLDQSSLADGTTYYYKVQAYKPIDEYSSNLTYASVAPAMAHAMGENEFIIESTADTAGIAAAGDYLAEHMALRETEIMVYVWVPVWEPEYYISIFNHAVEERENVSEYNRGDYLWYHLYDNGYSITFDDPHEYRDGYNRYDLLYKPKYVNTAEEEAQVLAKVDQVIADFGFTASTSTAEKVKRVYEWLSEDAHYDTSVKANGITRRSAYDAIINKRAVCQGYSNASYLFLRRLGIMNRIIYGTVVYDGSTIPHAWNLVKIDGKWYNFCATTEVHMREGYGSISYRYLLKADNDQYFSIFSRGTDSRGLDCNSTEFRSAHPVTESYVFLPTLPGLTVSPKSGVTMSLSWSAFSGATSYEVQCSANGTDFTSVKSTTGTSTSHTGLTAGSRYFYKIIAKSGSTPVAVSEIKAAVALATPTLNTPEPTNGGIKLTWSKASGADRYNIYRSTSQSGSYSYIESVQNTETYTDSSAAQGTTYYYKIRPYKKYDGIVYYGGYSNAAGGSYRKLENFEVSPKSGVTMTLSWSAVSGAKSYEVRYSTNGSSYNTAKSTTGTSTSHTGLTAGTLYWYKIVAKDSSGKAIATSAIKKAVALATPSQNTPTLAAGGVNLTWSKASGADRYNIYRSSSANGTYSYIQSVQKVENFTDTSAEGGKSYYYKIRAYKKVDGVVYYGGYSEYKGISCTKLNGLTANPKSGVTMTLNWSPYSNAQTYEVWHSTDGKTFTKVKATTGTSTSDTGLTAGTRYFYRITAKNASGSAMALSEIKAAVALATPTITGVVNTSAGVQLNWTKASGADRYNIYRSTSENGSYTYLESVQKIETYTDPSAQAGITYYYKVRPYKKYDGIVYYGGYSTCVSIMPF